MIVRRLSPPDAAAFRAVRLRALHDHPEAFTSSFEEDNLLPLAYSEQRLGPQSTAQYWGAFDGEALVGTVGLDRDKRVKTRHKALVIGMVVAPERVGLGVGRRLLDALVADARASGLARLVLTVTRGNQRAERLYESAGFKSFGFEPDAIQVGSQRFDKNHMSLAI